MPLTQRSVRVAACQVPDLREDSATALSWIRTFSEQASTQGAVLVCFPECFLQGYLTAPALAHRHAIDLTSREFGAVLAALRDCKPTIVFGLIEADGDDVFNTAVVVLGGRLRGRYRKSRILPRERVFGRGGEWPVFEAEDLTFGINICADTGVPEPAAAVATKGARLVVCPANNMLPRATAETWRDRHNEVRGERARENRVWLISSDVTGERDDRVSYGPTAVIDPAGRVVAQLPLMQVGVLCAEIPL